jgi:DNA polymerase-3 subunit gamma/tau
MARKKAPGSDDGAGADLRGSPGGGAAPAAKAYVVLARKYRPETFAHLIGQSAMVTTLRNAFATDRIAQGYMLTGVRGVGKTTTARILARALNFSKPGLPDRPTVEMEGYGAHCADIIQSRHPDVVEMDAASNTGIDNIREIIESARYKPLLARYKVFIIDEVHMLSKGAFNALLKTLEEPPAHVKFIFATTEIRKVPVTVLSRCQRFDLRRVEVGELVEHFRGIVASEGAEAESAALTLVARAAEGSVRDGLSMLDQAIAMGAGKVTADGVRAMIGLADRGRILDLLEAITRGATGEAIGLLASLHHDGANAVQVLEDLAEAVHIVTRIRIAGGEAAGEGLSGEERRRGGALAERLSVPLLSRYWQMLLKGIEEAARAPAPLAAAEMVVIRLAHTADLPTPDELVRMLAPGGGEGATSRPAAPPPAPPPRAPLNLRPEAPALPPSPAEAPGRGLGDVPATFEALVALVGERRDAMLKLNLEDNVRLVRYEPGRIELRPLDGAPASLASDLGEKLGRWTGRRWIVAISREAGERPLGELRREREAAKLAELRRHPAVEAVLAAFPKAEITGVRERPRPAEEPAAGLAEEDDPDSATG